MKRLQLLTVFLMLSALSFGQNQSITGVQPFISNPIGPQFLGQEIFRFQPGLVTQLGQGSGSFGFNEKWFSIGELNTGSQMVYGLRFQLPNRALTFGYQDTGDSNPRIQWIGEGGNLGNLEFRVANDFGSTNSLLVAKMRSDGATVFSQSDPGFLNSGEVLIETEKQFGAFSSTVGSTSGSISAGFFGIGNSPDSFNIGFYSRLTGAGINNVGIYVDTSNGANGIGGIFDGDIIVNGNFFNPSDIKLKDNIEPIKEILSELNKLTPMSYSYIETNKMSLAKGNQFGFIAQELENVFPDLISEIKKPVIDDNNNVTEYFEYKTINYLGLIAILTASVQELSLEIEKLKETNQSYVVYSDRLEVEEMERLKKLAYKLEQNYPNPFQGRTTIEYSIPDDEKNASIMVFNMTGKLLKEFNLREKVGKIEITSDEFQAGIYLYSLVSDNNEIITKKMIVK